MDLTETFGTEQPLVGMVHLPPLPGAPRYAGSRPALRSEALSDARALVESGFDGLLIENFGDAPFYPETVPPHTVAELTATVRELASALECPFGVNVLRNDGEAALSVAAATGGSFIRINVHTGVRASDQGWLSGRAHETMRLRECLDADVAVFADIAVKHSGAPVERDIETQTQETIERGLADGIVVSGPATGEPTDVDRLERVVAARNETDPDVPVFVGSGVRATNVSELLDVADGAIVGTATKKGGATTSRVDPERAAALVAAANR